MKLGKYIEECADLKIPYFEDWMWFINTRKLINQRLYLNKLVESDWYEVVVMLVVLANLSIVLASFFEQLPFYHNVEICFAIFYAIEFLTRFIGQGP
jgi:hypothetical protein